MILLGTQYYRPPFPDSRYWEEDFRAMRDAGLNTVQLWVVWGWVEAVSGEFRFDDYDRLMTLADRHGLGVILSTIAEIQPYWIHREVPGSEMMTNMGLKVVSSNRGECHFGVTPGGCTDHPGVWERMAAFLEAVGRHYQGATNLRGWDAWNELRWNVQADGLVCYCPHTQEAFRRWLAERYGSLDGLNRAWRRRYGRWDEVWPGKVAGRPFTELMAFNHFLTWRACHHAQQRYTLLKALSPSLPVTLHGGQPSAFYAGNAECPALDRGNDWFFADQLDGVGTSSFPKWSGIDDADFGLRVEFVKSAARNKRVWLSELQGGRAASGFQPHQAVDALSQQRWIWNGLACGADTILFWCWRDEVFGREAGGFGLIGLDGHAEERLSALRHTAQVLKDHGGTLASYRPAPATVGLLFSPQTYYHHWAAEGTAFRAHAALLGYARALVRRSIPYAVLEEEHLQGLQGFHILFLPRVTALSAATEQALERFVRAGGTLVCEAECGAFSPEGLYRYPEERFTTRLTGRHEQGRRPLTGSSVSLRLHGTTIRLPVTQWLTPWTAGPGHALALHPEGDLVCEVPVGQGRVVLCGAFCGEEYWRLQHSRKVVERRQSLGFETFVEHLVRGAGYVPDVDIVAPRPTERSFLYLKTGLCGDRRVLFVFFSAGQSGARLRTRRDWLKGQRLTDLMTGRSISARPIAADGMSEIRVSVTRWRFSVLVED